MLKTTQNYYDLSPYVNTVTVFKRNIKLLKTEIKRILKESDIYDPTILDVAVKN